MRIDELVTAVRISGGLPTADPTFTDARVREELHNALTTLFSRPIINSRQGYWRKNYDLAAGSGQTRYRLPARAVVGAIESVELFDTGTEPDPTAPRQPNYRFEGDQLVLASAPATSQSVRFRYYLRPSRFYAFQTAGLVTSVDDTLKRIVVNTLPNNSVTAVPIAVGDRLDVIHPNGWYELAVVGLPLASIISGTTLAFAASADLSQVEVGDYVRAAEQTDWPCLPEDFHRTLADATALAILVSKGDLAKGQILSGKVAQDIDRLVDLLTPRTMNNPEATVARHGMLRSRTRWRGGLA
jgi:hypothetical protein